MSFEAQRPGPATGAVFFDRRELVRSWTYRPDGRRGRVGALRPVPAGRFPVFSFFRPPPKRRSTASISGPSVAPTGAWAVIDRPATSSALSPAWALCCVLLQGPLTL